MAIMAHPHTMAGKTMKQQLQAIRDQRNRLREIEAAWQMRAAASKVRTSTAAAQLPARRKTL